MRSQKYIIHGTDSPPDPDIPVEVRLTHVPNDEGHGGVRVEALVGDTWRTVVVLTKRGTLYRWSTAPVPFERDECGRIAFARSDSASPWYSN